MGDYACRLRELLRPLRKAEAIELDPGITKSIRDSAVGAIEKMENAWRSHKVAQAPPPGEDELHILCGKLRDAADDLVREVQEVQEYEAGRKATWRSVPYGRTHSIRLSSMSKDLTR